MISKKEALEAMKGMANLRKELEKERARLKGSMKTLQKQARTGAPPDWAGEAMKLYSSPDYSHRKLLKLMHSKKVL